MVMEYLLVCDPLFVTYKFDWSLIIVIVITSTIIYIMALNGSIQSLNIKFVGFKIKWWYGLFYPGIILLFGISIVIGLDKNI